MKRCIWMDSWMKRKKNMEKKLMRISPFFHRNSWMNCECGDGDGDDDDGYRCLCPEVK